jgi:ABC-type nitrate/sulfonate/bicarbonate transport system ATPase subunit
MLGLELRGVVWSAGAHFGLSHDPVQVRRGTAAAVLAPADVATELADALTGLSRLVAGDIAADGVVITGTLPAPHRIALVPVGGGLLPHLSVTRNIELNLRRVSSRDARAGQVRDLARQFELDGALRLRPQRLSAEQRLRVAFARALAGQPAAVVVEDRAGQIDCGSTVRAVTAQNVAVLVLTDALARARHLSSRVYAARPAHRPDRPEPGRPGPDRPGPDRPGPDRPEEVRDAR